jgi:carboxyl-terminal processing protease
MEKKRTPAQRWRHLQLAALIAVVFTLGFALGSNQMAVFAQSNRLTDDEMAAFEPLFETYRLIDARYIDEIEIDTLVDGAIRGMVESLDDPYSNYVEPDLFEFVDTDLSGSINGIGVVITETEDGNEIEVVNVLEDTPAEASGLQPGDVFVRVDGEEVFGLTFLELAARVRGPAGSTVDLTMRRNGELIDFTVERARIEIPNVEYEVLEGNIGYISMEQFSSVARPQVDEALAELDVNALNGLIFDLRDNPGGFLSAAVDIAGLFLDDQTILIEEFRGEVVERFEVRDGLVYRIDNNGAESVYSDNATFAGIDVPIVVLVNERSASASELVTGAWQDAGVVTVIGETTFGKGTVQIQNELTNGGGVRLTIARWLTPNGVWISERGVVPDIIVEMDDTFDPAMDEDVQLKAALRFFESAMETAETE